MAAVDQPQTEVASPPPVPPVPGSGNDAPPAQPTYTAPVDPQEREPEAPKAPDTPPPPSGTLPPIVDPEGELEELEDRSAPVERTLWAVNSEGRRIERTYTQQGLMWFGKLELYGLLGRAVEVVLEGDNPLGIGSMLDMVQNPREKVFSLMGNLPGAEDAPDMSGGDDAEAAMELEAGKVLAAFAKVITMAPEILTQAYCIVLAIPKGHRPWATEWAFQNMDDEMGKDILHTFIDQNWGVMEDFFAHELPKVVKRIVKARRAHSDGRR